MPSGERALNMSTQSSRWRHPCFARLLPSPLSGRTAFAVGGCGRARSTAAETEARQRKNHVRLETKLRQRSKWQTRRPEITRPRSRTLRSPVHLPDSKRASPWLKVGIGWGWRSERRGRTQLGIKGFVPPNCHALYLKGTGQEVGQVLNRVNT